MPGTLPTEADYHDDHAKVERNTRPKDDIWADEVKYQGRKSPGRLSDAECYHRAKERGQSTFTLVAQDQSSPRIICEWIKENIETCGSAKLFEALSRAIEMRNNPKRKTAD